jgi:DNA ligase (NAD+)
MTLYISKSIMEALDINAKNSDLADKAEEIANLLIKTGEQYRAKAYKTASVALATHTQPIKHLTDLKQIRGIGDSIGHNLKEFMETGRITFIEELKNRPEILFTEIYGIGPKKAKQLADSGFKTIDDIKIAYSTDKTLLNDKQATGLHYYNDILRRIPREEIASFDKILSCIITPQTGFKYEIVGSYRRQSESSGDIDVILTTDPTVKLTTTFAKILETLYRHNIITRFLSQGNTKSLVIGKNPKSQYYRRIDFLFTPSEQYPFAILYFTGSKHFNTAMRGHALSKGLSMNEHGFTPTSKSPQNSVMKAIPTMKTEQDIFTFLELEYTEPQFRRDGSSLRHKTPQSPHSSNPTKPSQPQAGAYDSVVEYLLKGLPYLKTLTNGHLVKMILLCDDLYYNKSSPIMTDNQYDILKDYTTATYPTANVPVGAPIASTAKVALPYPMMSMNKKKDHKSVAKWFQKYPPKTDIKTATESNIAYILSAKLDGVSAMFYNENGERKLYTRGDGREGQDISHMVPYLSQLNNIRDKRTTVRGELLMKKSTFQNKYATQYANARNLTSGIVNQTNNILSPENIAKYKDIDFICYEVISPMFRPDKQLNIINDINQATPLLTRQFKTDEAMPTIEQLSETLQTWRDIYEYEMDGIIVTHNGDYPREFKNPEHAFAFKMVLTDQIAETIVTDVIWTPSVSGYLKPRIRVDPVIIGGATIEYVTGHDAKNIKENRIGIGAKVSLIRAGDVIPHIERVIEPAPQAHFPEKGTYTWTDTKVDIVLISSATDITVRAKQLEYFFKTMDIPDIGIGVINQLIKANYDTLSKILHVTYEELLELPSFKSTKATKIYNNIQSVRTPPSNTANSLSISPNELLAKLITASTVMGRGIAKKTAILILDTYPDIISSQEDPNTKFAKLLTVKGLGDKTSKAFVENIPKFRQFLTNNGLESYLLLHQMAINSTQEASQSTTRNPHVATGFTDKTLETYLHSKGIPLAKTLTKKTAVLYVKDKTHTSNKTEQAKKQGIPIIVYDPAKVTPEKHLEPVLKQLNII